MKLTSLRFSVIAAAFCLGLVSVPAGAVGFVVHVSDMQAWLKAHPEVDPKTLKNPDGSTARIVKVTTMKEWVAAHPDVFNPKQAPVKLFLGTGSYTLTPTLKWNQYGLKEPVEYFAVGIYNARENMKSVYERDRIPPGEIVKSGPDTYTWQVPKGVLKAGAEYYFQVVAFSKTTELKDVVAGYWNMRAEAK